MARKMRDALAELGYDGNDHRSQAISGDLLEWADAIICMGNVHEKFIAENFPEHSTKVENWRVKDPHFAKGEEEHKVVAKQLKELVLHHFG